MLYISLIDRDLHLESVLIGSDGRCKMASIGLSKLGLFHGRLNVRVVALHIVWLPAEVIIMFQLFTFYIVFRNFKFVLMWCSCC